MRYNPWADLRGRDHITFALHDIARVGGGGVYARRGNRAAIVIDPALTRTERRAVLAHELVHDERGTPHDPDNAPTTWRPVITREERVVDRIVAERLVPLDQLRAFAATRAEVGPVTVTDVADEFDVPEWVAHVACRLAR